METKESTRYILLGALMSGPKHGYEILQFLEAGLGPAWRISTSQLYVLLKRLDREGLVGSSLELQDTRPSKRIFSITPPGENDFLGWLKRPTDHVRDLRVDFLAKMFFFHDLKLTGGHSLVNAQIGLLKEVKEGLIAKKRAEKNGYNRLVFSFRIHTLTGWLNWLKKDAIVFVE